MSETKSEATPIQMAGLVVTGLVIANIAFYFLSNLYYEDRSAIYGEVTAAHIDRVRIYFGIFTGSIAAGTVASSLRPLIVGHVLAGLFAIASVVGGIVAFTHEMTRVLPVALLVGGLVMALLVWKSLMKSRSAWAFLIGMTSVLSAVMLFGSTKLRGVLDVQLYIALIIPGMLAVTTAALAMIRDNYKDVQG